MSVPLDLSLISQLLNEQRTEGDLNALTKPGFFYVINPTNTPNEVTGWCHVINLVNYIAEHTEKNRRVFQMCITDRIDENTVWYRQYNQEWTAWERFVTATNLADYYNKGVIDEKLGSKVNNSDLVADYYNKTDVDTSINNINTQLDTKAIYTKTPMVTAAVKIYDNNGTAHSETANEGDIILIGQDLIDQIGKSHLRFNLQDDYPANTKFTKIAITTERLGLSQILPATITIVFDANTTIVATLDTDNSDMEFFIYNVPTNLQTVPIGKGTSFNVYF